MPIKNYFNSIAILFFGAFIGGLIVYSLLGKSKNTLNSSDSKKYEIAQGPHARHSGHKNETASSQTIYTCPMHPEVRKNKPGQCPICHMNLVKADKKNKNHSLDKNLSLQVSPYQAKLIGIRPIKVKRQNLTYKLQVNGYIRSRSGVDMQVLPQDLNYLKKGLSFVGKVASHPDQVLRGELRSIDKFVDPSTQTLRVQGRLKSPPKNLISGSNFTGFILINFEQQLIIPEKAVLFTGKKPIAYTYKDKHLKPQTLILGPKIGESYIVLKGLKEDQKISSGPNFLLDSESKIRGINDQVHH